MNIDSNYIKADTLEGVLLETITALRTAEQEQLGAYRTSFTFDPNTGAITFGGTYTGILKSGDDGKPVIDIEEYLTSPEA